MGAATLRRDTMANANQPPFPRLWKRRWYVLRLLSGAIPSTWLYLFYLLDHLTTFFRASVAGAAAGKTTSYVADTVCPRARWTVSH